MNVKEWKLFPTLVMEVENFLSKDECKVLLEQFIAEKKSIGVENYPNSEHIAIGNAISSYEKDDYIYKKISGTIIPDFYNRLKICVDNYISKVKFPSVKIAKCWYNLQERNSLLKYHTHNGSVISGAIFINVDDESSNLDFINPNPFPDYISKSELSEYTYGNFSFVPKKGNLIIFPSYLKHGAPNFNNTQNRCVISFNTEYEVIQ